MNSIKRYFESILSNSKTKRFKSDENKTENSETKKVHDYSPNSIVSLDSYCDSKQNTIEHNDEKNSKNKNEFNEISNEMISNEHTQIMENNGNNENNENKTNENENENKNNENQNGNDNNEKTNKNNENMNENENGNNNNDNNNNNNNENENDNDKTYEIEFDTYSDESDEENDILYENNQKQEDDQNNNEIINNNDNNNTINNNINHNNIDTLIKKAVCFVEEMEKQQDSDDLSNKITKQPKSLKAGKLYPYQIAGIDWMRQLFENGSHGLLADEMGLGKTIQVIGFYSYLRENHIWGPVLIIAPLSTLGNWVNEFKKWCPSINTILYHGTKETREIKQKEIKNSISQKDIMNNPVIVTSYEICRIDELFLKQFTWFYIVVDEGHRLKNHNSILMKSLCTFAHNVNTSRLILTGTPLQNNLKELWSLLNFLLPDVFVSPEQFITWFDFSEVTEETYRQNLINTFREILSPFFLRRTKKDINIYLPPKREYNIYISMSNYQKEIYSIIYNQGQEYRELLNSENCCLNSKTINNSMMRLRECTCHPSILYEERNSEGNYNTDEAFINKSGKLHALDLLLQQLYIDKHRVLLFTQFTSMIHILEDYLTFRNYKYMVLNGSTSQEQRQHDIDLFAQDNTIFVYILTTRAGGQGINLSAADTCILYDSDWNPQMDIQATDRCHRLGQKNPVAVYRLITINSIDTHIMKICEDKKILEKIITYKNTSNNKLLRLSYNEYKQLIENNKIFTDDVTPITEKEIKRLAHVHAKLKITNKGKGWEIVTKHNSTLLDSI